MSIDYITVGKKIRAIRTRNGLSQLQLSEMIDVSPPYISSIENGVKNASIETLVKIANSLQVSLDELLDDNLDDELIASFRSFEVVLSDCNEYEKRILLDMVSSLKKALRDNSKYSPRARK
ncbi:MAG: helix-turn-helix transcriptional regulator [Clostridia bacterium]|nr:helix-turn-helix transcriptional regulator [Clostridia bacterium]